MRAGGSVDPESNITRPPHKLRRDAVDRRYPVDDIVELYDRWVQPLYMRLLHGNFRGSLLAEELTSQREEMIAKIRGCFSEVSSSNANELIGQPDWRPRLAGSWYAGMRGWVQFRDKLGELLVESSQCFACQGYCAALACYADDASAEHLRNYLDTWLPALDCFYDQHWALPALVWIDHRLDTRHAEKYLVSGGLWDQWAASHRREPHSFYLGSQRKFDLTLSSALAAFRVT